MPNPSQSRFQIVFLSDFWSPKTANRQKDGYRSDEASLKMLIGRQSDGYFNGY